MSSADFSLRSWTIPAFPSAIMPSVWTHRRVIIVGLVPVVNDQAANYSFDYRVAELKWLRN